MMIDRDTQPEDPELQKLKALYAENHRARYRHTIKRPKGNFYYAIRKRLGLSQTHAGKLIGITREAWQYRERSKLMYWPLELLVLAKLGGLTAEEFMQLLNDIA
jgi:hypothetical protein